MRFLMIDPFAKNIRESLTPKRLDRDFFRAEIGCKWVQRVKLTDNVEMWIDEECLLDSSGRQQFFTFFGYGAIHGGRAIVCGTSKMGDSISVPASFPISVLERHVQWLGGIVPLVALSLARHLNLIRKCCLLHQGEIGVKKLLLITVFAATIPLANWLISHVGTECVPNGPCVIPVGFGLSAPSGVIVIGAAMVLRDMIQQIYGARAALLAIAFGTLTAWFVAPPALVIASVASFAFAELANMAVYTPLRRTSIGRAILAGGIVGSVVDSALFLWLAFGSLDFITGQVVGKVWMSFAAYVVLIIINQRKAVSP